MPSENELAGMFQVSSTSVREAIKMLAGHGLVVVRRGLGAFVTEPADLAIGIDLKDVLSREKENLLELYNIRIILESEAAALAAKMAKPADIEKMEELLAKIEETVVDQNTNKEKLSMLNSEFHQTMHKASGNHTLVRLMASIMDSLTKGRRLTLQLPGREQASLADHKCVLNAIKNHDSQAARECMTRHLESVASMIRKIN